MKISHASSIDDSQEILNFNNQVVSWYAQNARSLPWRAMMGESANPYHVWLSEIMLQQTTVTAVIPYFEKFINLWPRINDLAAAEEAAVMDAWAGLGYYSRARNLHKCAEVVCDEYGGEFPQEEKLLLKLPGIGPYTAAAIMAIAFGQRAAVMDGNIERIFARYRHVEGFLPDIKPILKDYTQLYMLDDSVFDPSSLAQALMDIGATICQPKRARCTECPLSQGCLAYLDADLNPLDYPRKKVKERPKRYGVCFIVEDDSQGYLIERRPKKGLFANMYGLPIHMEDDEAEMLKRFSGCEIKQNQFVEHIFTHFHLKLYVVKLGLGAFYDLGLFDNINTEWVSCAEIRDVSLPSLFSKVVKII